MHSWKSGTAAGQFVISTLSIPTCALKRDQFRDKKEDVYSDLLSFHSPLACFPLSFLSCIHFYSTAKIVKSLCLKYSLRTNKKTDKSFPIRPNKIAKNCTSFTKTNKKLNRIKV